MSQSGYTALHHAAEKSKNMIELLLAWGVTINVSSYDQESCLLIAIEVQNVKTVEYLIHAGAALNDKDMYGATTPLHEASCKLNTSIVQILLSAGAVVNSHDNNLIHHCYVPQAS